MSFVEIYQEFAKKTFKFCCIYYALLMKYNNASDENKTANPCKNARQLGIQLSLCWGPTETVQMGKMYH